MAENTDSAGAEAGNTAPGVGPLSPDQQPATKADLYAAVDALRADMRELMDMVQRLIAEADRRVSDLERGGGAGITGFAGPMPVAGVIGGAGIATAAGPEAGVRARSDDDEW